MRHGVSAYQKASSAAQASPRELEAMLLMKGAAKLEAAKRNFESRKDLPDALTFNRKLWTILASSATAAENPLPLNVKQDFGSLAVFYLQSLISIAAEPAIDKIDRLIEINASIAAGLRS